MPGLSIAVITVSDTRTPETDSSGSLLAHALTTAGHRVQGPTIVRDELDAIRGLVAQTIAAGEVDVVILTGGTGLTARDVTPEAIAPLVTKPIPGFGELFRYLSFAEIGPSTIQSRAEGALCGRSLVFALPGSPNAVRLVLDKILIPQLDERTKPCNFAQLLPRMRGA